MEDILKIAPHSQGMRTTVRCMAFSWKSSLTVSIEFASKVLCNLSPCQLDKLLKSQTPLKSWTSFNPDSWTRIKVIAMKMASAMFTAIVQNKCVIMYTRQLLCWEIQSLGFTSKHFQNTDYARNTTDVMIKSKLDHGPWEKCLNPYSYIDIEHCFFIFQGKICLPLKMLFKK